jgi:fatty acid synthase subunit alpha
VNNLTPESFRTLVHGATSHSQGIVSAVVLATSTTDESFILNSIKASKWLLYSGLRGQEAFPHLALEPRIAQDAIEGGEGYPTPMLAVSGLARSTLDSHIAKTNAHLPENAQLFIGLHNGAKNAVVVGPARSLYGLVTALQKIRAPAGVDQSKIPFSQRKIVFSMRFFVVNVPYHSDYLQGATDKVFEIDLEGKELWTPEELAVPVFHTQDGALFVVASDVAVMWLPRFDSLFIFGSHVLHSSRLGFTQNYDVAHALALRSDVHTPSSLAQGHQLPRNRHACYRLRPQRAQWNWTIDCAQL